MGEAPDFGWFGLILQTVLTGPPLLRLSVRSRCFGKPFEPVELGCTSLGLILGMLFVLLWFCHDVSLPIEG